MSLQQQKIKFKARIKLNYNICGRFTKIPPRLLGGIPAREITIIIIFNYY